MASISQRVPSCSGVGERPAKQEAGKCVFMQKQREKKREEGIVPFCQLVVQRERERERERDVQNLVCCLPCFSLHNSSFSLLVQFLDE